MHQLRFGQVRDRPGIVVVLAVSSGYLHRRRWYRQLHLVLFGQDTFRWVYELRSKCGFLRRGQVLCHAQSPLLSLPGRQVLHRSQSELYHVRSRENSAGRVKLMHAPGHGNNVRQLRSRALLCRRV